MAFVYSKSAMAGPKPVDPGIYLVEFGGFKPAESKTANANTGLHTINLNFWGKLVNKVDPETGKDIPVYATLNEGIPGWIRDFHHSFGVEMVNDGEENITFPGTFEADPSTYDPDDLSTWKYAGPLIGKVAQWEIGISVYQGKESNKPRRFICAVDNCDVKYPDIKHASDMMKKG